MLSQKKISAGAGRMFRRIVGVLSGAQKVMQDRDRRDSGCLGLEPLPAQGECHTTLLPQGFHLRFGESSGWADPQGNGASPATIDNLVQGPGVFTSPAH
jgi:hypothetical protein